jgi:hypothetical protein
MKTQVKTIDVNAKEWFDRTNANSYFSAEVVTNYGQPDAQTFILPFQYGYENAYLHTALIELKKRGLIEVTSTADIREAGILLRHNIERNCKKRDLAK